MDIEIEALREVVVDLLAILARTSPGDVKALDFMYSADLVMAKKARADFDMTKHRAKLELLSKALHQL